MDLDRHQHTMSFGDHLEELRRRLIYALLLPIPILAVCLIFGGTLLEVLVAPLESQLRAAGQPSRLLATSPIEPFAAYLKVGITASLLVSAPWILYQVWLFVAPGLYRREKRFVYFLIPFSAVMTALAMAFLYFIMLPVMLRFFIVFGSMIVQADAATAPLPTDLSLPNVPVLRADPPAPSPGEMWFNDTMRELRIASADRGGALLVFGVPFSGGGVIAQQYRVGEYVNLVFGLGIVFTLAFQLPLVMLLLGWTGILRASDLSPFRKHALFGCVVLGAFFTPADPASMLLLAGPVYLLFEFGLVLMRTFPPGIVAGAEDEGDAS